MKEEEIDREDLLNYKYSCIKCNAMFGSVQLCFQHMTNICGVTPDDFPPKHWEKIWRRALTRAAKDNATKIKIKKIKNPSEKELVDQIEKFFFENPKKGPGSAVTYLKKKYGRPKFEKFGYGKIKKFIEKHGL